MLLASVADLKIPSLPFCRVKGHTLKMEAIEKGASSRMSCEG